MAFKIKLPNENKMTELEKYQLINKCETVEQLAEAMQNIAEDGYIKGRIKSFKVDEMINGLKLFIEDKAPQNVLTREYSIRQQAMYIKSWKDKPLARGLQKYLDETPREQIIKDWESVKDFKGGMHIDIENYLNALDDNLRKKLVNDRKV